jgi:hypothetical protein
MCYYATTNSIRWKGAYEYRVKSSRYPFLIAELQFAVLLGCVLCTHLLKKRTFFIEVFCISPLTYYHKSFNYEYCYIC